MIDVRESRLFCLDELGGGLMTCSISPLSRIQLGILVPGSHHIHLIHGRVQFRLTSVPVFLFAGASNHLQSSIEVGTA